MYQNIQSKVGIIVATFYKKISDHLINGAIEQLRKSNCVYEIIEVPGCFEIPSALKFAYNSGKFIGFVLLGCIIKGETDHYNFISQAIFNSILNLSTSCNIPIGVGILTTNDVSQAMERADIRKGNKGREATMACLRMIELISLKI